ncbi:hypothetical protein [Piscibacillus halophilus]|uniref:hypothetical protein n=1 Tax=Piscibacillus halophilus TaxID=571933 RepID=UPI00240A2424|nr:hypothetical protein [Piscibacillus halophilus]
MIEPNLSLEEYVQYIMEGTHRPLKAHELLYHAVQFAIKNDKVPLNVDRHLLNKVLEQYLIPASQGYDIQKRMLILVGPPGSGKSSLVHFLKKALETYSYTDQGAVFRISGCPMQEDPLLALPQDMREQLPIQVEGSLSPYNHYRLMKEWKSWRNVPIERFYISEVDRKGVGTFFPADPYSQDTSDLVGSIDYATITKYGSPSDPRAYRYDGEFQAANRGLLELQEVFKCEPKLLYPFLSLAEEKQYKISRQSLISADQVVIGHTNEPDLQRIVQLNQTAILNRMVFIKVPYLLSIDHEVSMYRNKVLDKDKERLGFKALDTLAAALILTRMKKPTDGMTKLEKLEKYRNRVTIGDEEGMLGLDPRYAFHVLSIVCAKNLNIIEVNDLLDELKRIILQDYRILEEQKETYLYNIQLAYKYYDHEWLKLIKNIIEKTSHDELQELTKISLSKNMTKLHNVLGIDESNLDHFLSICDKLLLDVNELTYDDLPERVKDMILDLFILSQRHYLDEWIENSILPQLLNLKINVSHTINLHLIKVIENYISRYL